METGEVNKHCKNYEILCQIMKIVKTVLIVKIERTVKIVKIVERW